jgi:hypothetical protein
MWYSWQTEEAFDQWHQTVITGLGLPKIGTNLASGSQEPDKQQTEIYTNVIECGSSDFRAFVETVIAETYSVGLGELSNEPEWGRP